jgi:hypothetical protein
VSASPAAAWKNVSERLIGGAADVNRETLDRHAVNVDEQIDLLVNYTAGDGFLTGKMRAVPYISVHRTLLSGNIGRGRADWPLEGA